MSGWIAAIAGYLTFAYAANKSITDTEDSALAVPWYVPDYLGTQAQAEANRIQAEQKERVEEALMKAFATGALVMVGTGVAFWALWSRRQPRRRRS